MGQGPRGGGGGGGGGFFSLVFCFWGVGVCLGSVWRILLLLGGGGGVLCIFRGGRRGAAGGGRGQYCNFLPTRRHFLWTDMA